MVSPFVERYRIYARTGGSDVRRVSCFGGTVCGDVKPPTPIIEHRAQHRCATADRRHPEDGHDGDVRVHRQTCRQCQRAHDKRAHGERHYAKGAVEGEGRFLCGVGVLQHPLRGGVHASVSCGGPPSLGTRRCGRRSGCGVEQVLEPSAGQA
jgi:hypothetical protein